MKLSRLQLNNLYAIVYFYSVLVAVAGVISALLTLLFLGDMGSSFYTLISMTITFFIVPCFLISLPYLYETVNRTEIHKVFAKTYFEFFVMSKFNLYTLYPICKKGSAYYEALDTSVNYIAHLNYFRVLLNRVLKTQRRKTSDNIKDCIYTIFTNDVYPTHHMKTKPSIIYSKADNTELGIMYFSSILAMFDDLTLYDLSEEDCLERSYKFDKETMYTKYLKI